MQGVTALHLAVYKYENSRSLEITKILLENGANVSIKAAVPPSAHKISIVRKDKKTPHGEILLETRKITLGQKTALLLALELKSSLYLRGIWQTPLFPPDASGSNLWACWKLWLANSNSQFEHIQLAPSGS